MSTHIPPPDPRLHETVKIIPFEKKAAKPRPPEFSDEELALRFADQHSDDLRFVASWNKWMIWDGRRWHPDDTLFAFNCVRQLCREAVADCKDGQSKNVASAKTVGAVHTLAKADRRLAATVEQWDADPWLLNTPGGVIDLRTGKQRQHEPDDYMTKITSVAADGSCPIPLWTAFLDRVTGNDVELAAFLACVLGYGLTGTTAEHAIFFAYGTGANGKSVLTGTAAGIVGDYHVTAPIETFTASTYDRHPTDLAGLRGARLVTAVETEEGRRWAESRIKVLTGGDKIAARYMRQDFFEYVPQFKLLISGNHKPGLRSVDEAIRRRFHLIPFAITIPPGERDLTLPERLKAEWPGILAWMIDGCLKWRDCGLAPPEAVLAATTAYLDAEDAIAAWMDESGERDPNAWESSTILYQSFKDWAEKAGEHTPSQKRFIQNLESHGLMLQRKASGRGLLGLRLRASDLLSKT